jgi:peptidoglycan/xylan/chitin deacetylase (PgdA/CDA1 family)
VSESWPADLSVTPARLQAQLTYLKRRGYRGVTFHQAVSRPSSRAVAITFDDAFRSVHEVAFPILSRHGFTATVFVPTAFLDRDLPMSWPGIDHWLGGPHANELHPMSWEELRALASAGWEIGSHTRTHPRLTELDGAALTDELSGSRADCAREIGAPCRSLSYPFGDHDERVVAAADRAGYSAACTLTSRPHAAEPLRWPRVGVYHRDHALRFRLKLSRTVRRIRTVAF